MSDVSRNINRGIFKMQAGIYAAQLARGRFIKIHIYVAGIHAQ